MEGFYIFIPQSQQEFADKIRQEVLDGKNKVALANRIGIVLLRDDNYFAQIAKIYGIEQINQTLQEQKIELFKLISESGLFYIAALQPFFELTNNEVKSNNPKMALEVLEGFDTLLSAAEISLNYPKKFHRGLIWHYRSLFYLVNGQAKEAAISIRKILESDLKTYQTEGQPAIALIKQLELGHYNKIIHNPWFVKMDLDKAISYLKSNHAILYEELFRYSYGSILEIPKVSYPVSHPDGSSQIQVERDITILSDNSRQSLQLFFVAVESICKEFYRVLKGSPSVDFSIGTLRKNKILQFRAGVEFKDKSSKPIIWPKKGTVIEQYDTLKKYMKFVDLKNKDILEIYFIVKSARNMVSHNIEPLSFSDEEILIQLKCGWTLLIEVLQVVLNQTNAQTNSH